MCAVVQLLSVVAILCDFSGWCDHQLVLLNSGVYRKGVGSVFDKTTSTHLVGTESDLQCCNGGEGQAEIFPLALRS